MGTRYQRVREKNIPGTKKQPLINKESQRWITALLATDDKIPPDTIVVTVADSEADIYDLLATPRNPNSELLIPAHHNRCVRSSERKDEQAQRLQDAIRRSAPIGQITLELREKPDRAAREAILTLRTISVEIQPPTTHPNIK